MKRRNQPPPIDDMDDLPEIPAAKFHELSSLQDTITHEGFLHTFWGELIQDEGVVGLLLRSLVNLFAIFAQPGKSGKVSAFLGIKINVQPGSDPDSAGNEKGFAAFNAQGIRAVGMLNGIGEIFSGLKVDAQVDYHEPPQTAEPPDS